MRNKNKSGNTFPSLPPCSQAQLHSELFYLLVFVVNKKLNKAHLDNSVFSKKTEKFTPTFFPHLSSSSPPVSFSSPLNFLGGNM